MPPSRQAPEGQPTARAARPGGTKAEPKVLGIPRNYAVGVGLVFVGALVWIVWHRKKATSTSTGTTTSTTGYTGTYAGLPPWLTTAGTGTGTGGGGVSGVAGTGTSGTGSSTGTGSVTGATPGSTSTGTTTKTGTTTAAWSYPAPTGLTVYNKTNTGYFIKWNAVKGPQGQVPASYTVRTYNSSGSEVNSHDTVPGSTSTAEYGPGGKGLKAGTYHTNVWANGGPVAPPHADTGNITLKG